MATISCNVWSYVKHVVWCTNSVVTQLPSWPPLPGSHLNFRSQLPCVFDHCMGQKLMYVPLYTAPLHHVVSGKYNHICNPSCATLSFHSQSVNFFCVIQFPWLSYIKRDCNMFQHAQGSTVWKLCQFRCLQTIWRWCSGQGTQYVCEASYLHTPQELAGETFAAVFIL